MLKAIFFDWGNVLAAFQKDLVADWERSHGLPADSLWQTCYGCPEWSPALVGDIDEAAWLTASRRHLEETAGRSLPTFDEVTHAMWRPRPELLSLAANLSSQYRVGVLSNATRSDNGPSVHDLAVGGRFDVVINSAVVRVAKPDAGIFQHAAGQFGLAPESCLLIDDLAENIDGARAAGMGAIHFASSRQLFEALRALGITS